MKLEELLTIECIVFYDGSCGFCNSSIQFILKHKAKDFYFIPLQSKLAEEILALHHEEIKMNTLYFFEKKELYQKSTAAIRITKHLSGIYPIFFYLGYLIPKFLRDWGYDQIAKRRHKIKAQYCTLPSATERKFFIDNY
ncbi:thiol-disulfide oxidoreductase DCC family protein [Brumimicrobium aurantiacum]|uniref:DUF393 domain-containing protein n=1 Tax=Brumimicrobium aurantiacum TaxID=1737063 RepID=A0A3E1F063_9FLAO|nr:DUF393 domain-containing protein [Brumimicrobium aurantiacum]RFC55190.1 DUF393 domain-containing protein [Brumimicrobium aurantiacum]